MDREQLFQNLNELEKQLKGIKSATEQVNAISAANRAVIDSVKEYTAQTQKMLDSIRNVYDGDVKEIKAAAEKALTQSSEDFDKKVNSIAKDLVASTANLKSMVEDTLTPLVKNDLVDVIDEKLKPFVIDEMPASFNKIISEYYSFLENERKNLATVVKEFSDSSEAALNELKTTAQAINDSQAKISETFTGFEGKLNAISEAQAETNKKVGSLSDSLKDTAEMMKESSSKVKRSVSSLEANMDNIQRQLSGLSETIELLFEEFKSSVNTLLSDATKETAAKLNATAADLSRDMTVVLNTVKPVKQLESWARKEETEIEDIKKSVAKNHRLNILNMALLSIVLLLLLYVFFK